VPEDDFETDAEEEPEAVFESDDVGEPDRRFGYRRPVRDRRRRLRRRCRATRGARQHRGGDGAQTRRSGLQLQRGQIFTERTSSD